MAQRTRFRVTLEDGSRIVVARLGIHSDHGGWRRAYGYVVRSSTGDLVTRGRDLFGPVGLWLDSEAPTAASMTGSLLAFMEAAGEHYRYARMWGAGEASDYRPHFSEQVDSWCYQVDQELGTARLELEAEGR